VSTRSYGQYCALAKSLDVVGDRWTLLIVRELLDGPARYGDLLAGLAPIATDMLAGRLRDLEASGLVCKRALPKPASGSVYELTDDGRALDDVINAYARWGRQLLQTRAGGDVVRPEWLARAVRAYVRADRPGVDLALRLATPEGSATMRITADTVATLPDDSVVDVTLEGQAETLMAAMDPARVAALVASGALRIDGTKRALRQLAGVFGA
jgi:DNA-binding HxlR family transcriptional regulator